MEKKFLKLICPGIKHHEDFIAAQNVNKQKKKNQRKKQIPWSTRVRPSRNAHTVSNLSQVMIKIMNNWLVKNFISPPGKQVR